MGAISSVDRPAAALARSSIWWGRGLQPRAANHAVNGAGRIACGDSMSAKAVTATEVTRPSPAVHLERWQLRRRDAVGEAPASTYVDHAMRPHDLLIPTPAGLYCPPGDFHIDPVRSVDRALITHGHADHARPGHGSVLATAETLKIMAVRYGDGFAGAREAVELGSPIRFGPVTVSFHPAGHVLGSAQILVEHRGLRIVASGDYKRRADPTCLPFVPVPCDIFITEATFALPVFRHPDPQAEIAKLMASIKRNPDRAHLVGAYALGKGAAGYPDGA